MNILGRGVHATAIQWPGFSTDPWPQELTDFFGVRQDQILNQIIRALWVGGESGHYVSEVNTPNGWSPLPNGAYLVKYAQGGALYAFDATTFALAFRTA